MTFKIPPFVGAVLAALALSGCVAFGDALDRSLKYEHLNAEAGKFFSDLDTDIRNLWSK